MMVAALDNHAATLHSASTGPGRPTTPSDGADVTLDGTHAVHARGILEIAPNTAGATVADVVVYGYTGSKWVQIQGIRDDDGSKTLAFDGGDPPTPRGFLLTNVAYTRLHVDFDPSAGNATVRWIPVETV